MSAALLSLVPRGHDAASTLADAGLSATVSNGSLIAAIGVSVLVGLVGFASPCVLPLVPGYLSYVAGLSGSQVGGPGGTAVTVRRRQGRMVGGALLFILGFTVVFVSAGALFGTLGESIIVHKVLLEQIFGAVTIVMGVVFIGEIPFLQREVKIHRLPRAGLLGAPVLGFTFGLAWAPCITPTLTAVLSLATTQATAGRGAVLSAAYCFGLGVPFILVAIGFGWITGAVSFLRRHTRAVSRIGGGLLIVFGILMITGTWDSWMYRLNSFGATSFFGAGL